MNVNQRKRILQNIDSLVNLTDFDELCQASYNNHLLSSTMIQNICSFDPRHISEDFFDEDMIKKERHKRLLIKITKRGPDAFENLHRIFAALKYNEALNILFGDNESMISINTSKKSGVPTSGNNEINETNAADNVWVNKEHSAPCTIDASYLCLHEYKGIIQPKKNIPVRMATRIIIDPIIGTYLMESKNNRGIFFMVSSDEHCQGLDEDAQSLLSLFQQLGFKLYAYSNITLTNFFDLLEELLNSEKIINIECFVLALKTGCRIINGIQWLTFSDGSVVKLKHIQKYFYHQNCRKLVGKPKIFIYPYSEIPNKRIVNSNKIQTDSARRETGFEHVAQLSDVINCYTTTKGFMDERDNGNYSRYIQCFVNIVAQHACDTHFENMLKIIQDHVAKLSITSGHLQMSSYDNISFNKMLYFNPGLSVS